MGYAVDIDELNKLIDASGKSKTYLAAKMGISRVSLFKKLNSKTSNWDVTECVALAKELKIDNWADFRRVFYSPVK